MPKIYQIKKNTFEKDLAALSPAVNENILKIVANEYSRAKGPFSYSFGNMDIKLLAAEGLPGNFILFLYKKNEDNERDEKLKFLGEISTNLFHEINGPLNVMISSLEILKVDLSDEFPEEVSQLAQSKLDVFELGLVKFCNIIRGLQNFSQGKHEAKEINLERFNKSTIDFANIFLTKNHIKINYKQNGVISETFKMSDSLMSQVLINLIKNSSDHIKDYPAFNKWIELIMEEDDKHIIYKVKDSGKGISEENQSRLFNYGFTTKAIGQGTGIGLSFCKKIVEQHRGEIFYDKKSENTTFVIKLPKN